MMFFEGEGDDGSEIQGNALSIAVNNFTFPLSYQGNGAIDPGKYICFARRGAFQTTIQT